MICGEFGYYFHRFEDRSFVDLTRFTVFVVGIFDEQGDRKSHVFVAPICFSPLFFHTVVIPSLTMIEQTHYQKNFIYNYLDFIEVLGTTLGL